MSDKTDHPPVPEAFVALGVRPSILRALAEAQFVTPSEIQSLLIPRALAGVDILGQARTGTGKTAAFGLPILQKCQRGLATQAIVMVPTRELCTQVEAELKRLAQFTPLRIVAVYGGQRISAQMKFLKHGPEIIVGTPGRVIDLLERRILRFDNIRFVVLDEVDRMLDIGFRDDIRNILSRVKGMRHRLPPDAREGDEERGRGRDRGYGREPGAVRFDDQDSGDERGNESEGSRDQSEIDDHEDMGASATGHQTMFVSATISDEIERLARRYMREPVEKLIAPGADDKPTVEKVEQFFFAVEPWDKYRLLKKLLDRENPDLAIVFCRTKHGAEKLAHRLHGDGIECREIHGNLNQNSRERVMKNFRNGKFDILVATDLASRGIDVADISHIINYDIPDDPEVYVHRVGRTARMGAEGKAYTFVSRGQGDELTKVENLINMVIPQGTLEGWTPNPQPSDWKEGKPGIERQGGPSGPAPSAGSPSANHPPVPLPPPRRLGSKMPLGRRHKKLR
jgi:superfamily II DNA/RNA helicase